MRQCMCIITHDDTSSENPSIVLQGLESIDMESDMEIAANTSCDLILSYKNCLVQTAFPVGGNYDSKTPRSIWHKALWARCSCDCPAYPWSYLQLLYLSHKKHLSNIMKTLQHRDRQHRKIHFKKGKVDICSYQSVIIAISHR